MLAKEMSAPPSRTSPLGPRSWLCSNAVTIKLVIEKVYAYVWSYKNPASYLYPYAYEAYRELVALLPLTALRFEVDHEFVSMEGNSSNMSMAG